jgi:FKBP-type peptidyl-prolyl cis-trans isomerase 2
MKLKDLSKDDSALTKKFWVVVVVLIMVAASGFAAATLLTPDPPQTVSPGDDVSVDYIGFVNSTGTPQVFDTSEWSVAIDNTTYPKVAWFTIRAQSAYDPLNFTAGNGQVVIGFDQGVLGMEEGETKTIVITPEQGYGQIDTSKLVKFNLTSSVPLFVETTISLFKTKFGVDAVGGLTVQDPNYKWAVSVLNVDSTADRVLYKNMAAPNETYAVFTNSASTFETGWNIKIDQVNTTADNGNGTITFTNQVQDDDSWDMVGYDTFSGSSSMFVLIDIDTANGTAVKNFNSPLKGQVMTFQVTMLNIESA